MQDGRDQSEEMTRRVFGRALGLAAAASALPRATAGAAAQSGRALPAEQLCDLSAIELAVRYEQLTYESASKEGTSFTNPRAEFLTPNSDKVFTFGVNWITSKWTRVLVNAIHEELDDATRAPIPGTSSFWSGLVRLYIVF